VLFAESETFYQRALQSTYSRQQHSRRLWLLQNYIADVTLGRQPMSEAVICLESQRTRPIATIIMYVVWFKFYIYGHCCVIACLVWS